MRGGGAGDDVSSSDDLGASVDGGRRGVASALRKRLHPGVRPVHPAGR